MKVKMDQIWLLSTSVGSWHKTFFIHIGEVRGTPGASLSSFRLA